MPDSPSTSGAGPTTRPATSSSAPRQETTETFAYDALDRLIGQDIAGGIDASWSYAYGPNHNRRSRSNADQRNELYSYKPGTNRLSAIDRFVAQPEPDPPASVQFDYNQAGRLSEYSENGVLTASYTYNTFGLRTRKQTDAGTTVFHYDTGVTLLAETDQIGAPVRDYIWFNGSPVATVDAAGNVSYIHTDHLFTPRLATDATGGIVWEWAGEAFGDVEPTGTERVNLFPTLRRFFLCNNLGKFRADRGWRYFERIYFV